LASSRLTDVERSWGPAREALALKVEAAGYSLENSHWDWRNKTRYYPPGWHCLIAVEYDGLIQGLLAVESLLRPSRIDAGRWVLYVDFLEVAPWNRREPPGRSHAAVQEPRLSGVGTLLIGEAVRMSMGKASGRIGLHALSGSEEFYSTRCLMRRIGPDPDYHNLVYFEYPDGVSMEWLIKVGLSA
jgi:hypothetical protein